MQVMACFQDVSVCTTVAMGLCSSQSYTSFKAGDAILGECIKLESVVEMTYCDPQLIVLSCHLWEQWERENLSRSETRTESAALQSHLGTAANSSACCNCPSGHHYTTV